MRLSRLKTNIPNKPYITKKLDPGTVHKLLESSSFVVSGIFEIKNDAHRLHQLYEQKEVGDCKITGYVKVKYAYAGAARAQINNITPWRDLIRSKPSYDLKINLYNAVGLIVFSFNCKYTNVDILYDDIESQTRILEEAIFSEMKQN